MDNSNCWPGTNIVRRDVQRLSAGEQAPNAPGETGGTPIELLNRALGIARAAIRRCEREYYAALRNHSPALAGAALVHANEAKIHKDRIGARILELGGKSEPVDAKVDGPSATLLPRGGSLANLIDHDVAADRAAIDSLREIAQCFAAADPMTHMLIDEIVAAIEERAGTLEQLL